MTVVNYAPLKFMVLFFVFATFIGCSGTKVQNAETAAGTDLSRYKTFGFYEIDTAGLVNPEYYISNVEALKKSVITQMVARGYSEATNPDLKINMGVTVEEKAQTRETDFRTDRTRYMGQRNYSWQSEEIVVGYYKEGTLDFHLVDAKENKMVWRATISDVVPTKQKNVQETIDRNVKKLFEKFPVKEK
jgi:hypothetical protein